MHCSHDLAENSSSASIDACTTIPLSRFLTLTTCPEQWIHHDLYVIRDETTTFYVGQSECAYARVWSHLQDGFKGRSVVGKFVRVNWPQSIRFTIELLRTRPRSGLTLVRCRNEAERWLIGRLKPCFNETHNPTPTPVPEGYLSPEATVRYPRHLGNMMREAEHVERRRQNSTVWE